MINFKEWLLTENIHESTGKISIRSNGLIIILVDNDLGEYYRKRFNYTYRTGNIVLMRPKWGPHISITREGEEYPQDKISLLNDRPIKFKYSHNAEGNGFHFWLPVECQEAVEIRKNLGLPDVGKYPLHLTFGVTTTPFHGTDAQKTKFQF